MKRCESQVAIYSPIGHTGKMEIDLQMVTGVEWADPERPLSEISLGGLIALVIIRAIHRNASKTRVSISAPLYIFRVSHSS